MTCNFTGKLRANINWEVTLSRKACLNENESARRRLEYVTARDQAEVRKIIADDPKFKAFRVSSIREAREKRNPLRKS